MLPHDPSSRHAFLIGIDVGKESLAVFIAGDAQSLTIPNQTRAIRALIRRYPQASFALEATGGYEMAFITAAASAGNTVFRVNARRVRAFMESRGILAKTDAIDARAIADYARANLDTLQPFALPDKASSRLRQFTRRRDELIAMRTQESNRRGAPDNKALQASINAVLVCLNAQIARMDAAIAAVVAACPELTRKRAVMTQVKGIGDGTAAMLLGALPELGTLSGKQIAALAGLAPHPRDSGKTRGYRRTGRGRADVRRALFMAALSAARYHPTIKIFYERLCKNGKKPMVALVAAARKLLVILNAKLRDATPKPA